MAHHRRPVRGLLGVAAVALTFLAAGCGSTPPTPLSLAAFVQHGAEATLNRRTADLTLSGTVLVAGHSIPVHGTGQSDFTAHAMEADMTMAMEGHTMAMAERLVGGRFYLGMNVDGQTMKKLTGRDWYVSPIPITGSGGGFGDPSEMLALAAQQGSRVVGLGSSTIDGLQVTGYAVTPSRAAMLHQARAKLHLLPAADRPRIERMLRSMKPPTISMWFDQGGQDLLRRLSVRMSLSFGTGASAGGVVQFDFKNYGTPVDIPVPAPGDVGTKLPGQ